MTLNEASIKAQLELLREKDNERTEYVPAPPGQKVLVTMPDGYRVWPDDYGFDDDRSYFAICPKGIGEHGERVTVRGDHIARVQPALVMPKEAIRRCRESYHGLRCDQNEGHDGHHRYSDGGS